ncbi:probable arabinosyltransferase ARAD1 [Tanacetum coccineum]
MGICSFNFLPEKVVHIWRLVACLFVVSILFLVLSPSLLIRFGDTSLVPISIYKLNIVDNTPSYIKHDETEPIELMSPPSVGSSCNESCFKLKPIERDSTTVCWKGHGKQIWPNVSNLSRIPVYPGGVSVQHSMEYWLTLDLLSSDTPNVSRPCRAILVQNSSQADVIFVPFFSSWSYNLNCKIRLTNKNKYGQVLQERLMEYLIGTKEWKRSGGNDHLIMAHHPNSLLLARRYLRSAMFVFLDFGEGLCWCTFKEEFIGKIDDIELPFEDVLDYSKFAIFVRASDASKKGYLMKLIRGVQREKWIEMWKRLKQIAAYFEYEYPSKPDDAVDMIWQAIHRKVSSKDIYVTAPVILMVDAKWFMFGSLIQANCTFAILQMAYNVVPDVLDEYLQMRATIARDYLVALCPAVMKLYGNGYLRKPAYTNIEKLYVFHEQKHKFPMMIGRIDCMDWSWGNFPNALKAQFSSNDHGPDPFIL